MRGALLPYKKGRCAQYHHLKHRTGICLFEVKHVLLTLTLELFSHPPCCVNVAPFNWVTHQGKPKKSAAIYRFKELYTAKDTEMWWTSDSHHKSVHCQIHVNSEQSLQNWQSWLEPACPLLNGPFDGENAEVHEASHHSLTWQTKLPMMA